MKYPKTIFIMGKELKLLTLVEKADELMVTQRTLHNWLTHDKFDKKFIVHLPYSTRTYFLSKNAYE